MENWLYSALVSMLRILVTTEIFDKKSRVMDFSLAKQSVVGKRRIKIATFARTLKLNIENTRYRRGACPGATRQLARIIFIAKKKNAKAREEMGKEQTRCAALGSVAREA